MAKVNFNNHLRLDETGRASDKVALSDEPGWECVGLSVERHLLAVYCRCQKEHKTQHNEIQNKNMLQYTVRQRG